MAALCVFVLFLIVPFEPRFTVPLGPIRLSLIEAVAIPCFAAIGWSVRGRRPAFVPRPALALVLMTLVAGLSAVFADVEPARAFKFALRLGAMTGLALLASRLDEYEARSGFVALSISGAAAALLAIGEGAGLRFLDVFLGAFREIPFNVAGIRRASAGSEYPNLGAAMILYALIAGVALLGLRFRPRLVYVTVLALGLAFTYSRGAWIAGLGGLLVLCLFERGPRRFAPVIVYLATLGAFVGRQEISQIRFGGENANDFYAATYETPRQFALEPSARIIVPVTVRNVGRRPWRRGEEIHLSYHLYQNASRPLVDGPRSDLPRDVLPGESATVDAALRAPARPGEYVLMWDLVHEDTTWFSGQGVKPGLARLIVGRGDGTPAATSPPPAEEAALQAASETLAWRPARSELWRLALRMWKENPFLGVGPDNYRWTYGTLAGKTAFDTRVFSNNMFLEFASTLGTLGLASFCAALALALHSGWVQAQARTTALVALAIAVAMTVHGLADYVLAFTGHYLVFGFCIGVLSRETPKA